MLEPGLGRKTLFLAEHADAFAAEPAETGDQRFVFAEFAVAGQRREIGDQPLNVIDAVRPLRMARHLGLLPGRQRRIELAERLQRLLLDLGDLFADVAAGICQGTQLVDLGIEFRDGLFKIEVAAHRIGHGLFGELRAGSGDRGFSGQMSHQVKRLRQFK